MSAVSVVDRKMLHCPKCNNAYQEGTQRFCINDGTRLISSSTIAKSPAEATGVFTNLLRKVSSNSDNDEKLAENPRFSSKSEKTEPPKFHTTFSSKVFKDENLTVKKDGKPIETSKPVVRLVKPAEIASGTAELGDRKTNPTGRPALTWDDPEAVVGQTIKGRYYITEFLNRQDSGLVYRAEDRIIADKFVIVRVLMDEKNDDLLSKIFSEERVSLSHVNHPNVVSVLDSGELLEGVPFVVTEEVDGFSLSEKLQKLEQFNPLRTARVARQISYALSEVHQNGILHRSLKPSNIFMTVSEVGSEQIKVTDFAVANGAKKENIEHLKYLSPEQLEGKMPNYASDIYSLGVIAYQMLTGKLPFDFESPGQILKAQKDGVFFAPSKLRNDISPGVDEVFAKVLAYDPDDRFPKARDFGDSLFNSLSLAPVANKAVRIEGVSLKQEEIGNLVSKTTLDQPGKKENQPSSELKQIKIEAKKKEPVIEVHFESDEADSEPAWEKRSPEPIKIGSMWLILSGVGIVVLGLLLYLGWNYLQSKLNLAEDFGGQQNITSQTPETPVSDLKTGRVPAEIESPPLPRQTKQPQGTEYFENTKTDLKGDLAQNYRGFSLFYPKTWSKTRDDGFFLDISKNSNDLPVEQLTVTYYQSTGLFSKDKVLFPKLVEKSNNDLSRLQDYRVVSEGEANIQNGRWNVFEVRFQGSYTKDDGKKITVWGRRFWLPPQDQRIKNGLVVTLLATSLSTEITSTDDVGTKGDLAGILETFEPSQSD